MTCRHCHKPIGRTASWQQVYVGGRFVDLCSLACVHAYLEGHAS